MYQRLFVPLDNSQSSLLALREACRLAEHGKGQLNIVHVLNLNPASWASYDMAMEPDIADVSEDQCEILQDAREIVAGYQVQAEYNIIKNRLDPIASILADAAALWNADLIVMSTHGWTGLKRLLLGSVAEGLLRTSQIPTLLIRTTD